MVTNDHFPAERLSVSLDKMKDFQHPAVLNISNEIIPDKEMTRALVTVRFRVFFPTPE
jgi:hypothetical protein